jgi:hypothetical protein
MFVLASTLPFAQRWLVLCMWLHIAPDLCGWIDSDRLLLCITSENVLPVRLRIAKIPHVRSPWLCICVGCATSDQAGKRHRSQDARYHLGGTK